jgi:hypothetical protein
MSGEHAMTSKTPPPGRTRRPTVRLEIELPVLSDGAAAAMTDVMVQLYRRFEATDSPRSSIITLTGRSPARATITPQTPTKIRLTRVRPRRPSSKLKIKALRHHHG